MDVCLFLALSLGKLLSIDTIEDSSTTREGSSPLDGHETLDRKEHRRVGWDREREGGRVKRKILLLPFRVLLFSLCRKFSFLSC